MTVTRCGADAAGRALAAADVPSLGLVFGEILVLGSPRMQLGLTRLAGCDAAGRRYCGVGDDRADRLWLAGVAPQVRAVLDAAGDCRPGRCARSIARPIRSRAAVLRDLVCLTVHAVRLSR